MTASLIAAGTIQAAEQASEIGTLGLSSSHCIHLKYAGAEYSISYPNQECPHRSFPPIPSELFEPLSNWISNIGGTKLISPLVHFQIFARLASLDTKHDHGFAFGPCAIGPWSVYGWAEHADFAYLALKEDLPDHPEISTYVANEATRLGLAKRDEYFGISFIHTKLSSTKKKHLIDLFREVELRLIKLPEATKPLVTPERYFQAHPAHRKTMTVFELME